MINHKRLARVETALTPKAAVILWLRNEHQGKTTRDYVQKLVQMPARASTRSRVGREVAGAVRASMKGRDPDLIRRAARQAQMEADFLILVISRTNSAVVDQCKDVWLGIGSFLLRLHAQSLADETSQSGIVDALRSTALLLFSLELAIERIQSRLFDGECILTKDVKESLELPTAVLQHSMECIDQELQKLDRPDLVVDSTEFRKTVSNKAEDKVRFLCALAKSVMLQDFGEADAANGILRMLVLADR